MRERYQWDVKAEWLVFLPGLVSGLHLTVRALTEAAEAVVIPNPIYPPFRAAARSAGRPQRLAPMRIADGRWCVDFAAAERCSALCTAVFLYFKRGRSQK
ncbi:hypothetical protein CE195_04735 [Sodalis-like symbiont of Philaenus spumarius]|nr:hypothetical protein CE195_04735 [Sodalis-like symbiont of Philaenus spumarius]